MSEEKKPRPRHKETGWCLALHYFTGDRQGVEVERPEPLPPSLHGAPWLYCGDELLAAENWAELVRDWQQHVGTIALWVSDCRYSSKPGARITREGLRTVLDNAGWDCLEDEICEGRSLLVYRKNGLAEGRYRPWRKAERNCLVIRGGAFGDALIASSVLPALKDEGWSIDFACNEFGHEVLRHDPHIDRFMVAHRGLVTDYNIGAYWTVLGARYDRVVNLSYTLEHTLLKRPWDGAYFWPDETRRRLCAGSYLANNHTVAGVKAPYRVKFYPSPAEAEAAAKVSAGLGPFVLWALRGSAVHKWYPYAPQLAVRLLVEHPGLALVLSGGRDAAALEAKILDAVVEFLGPEAARRVHSMVDTGSIRRVLAMAPHAALVIGQETGVLNAVGQEPVPKVCLLSHSSPSNLTDDWLNAVPVLPEAPCWPCHRLHYSHEHCPQDARTGAAACQASIAPEQVMKAVRAALALRPPAPAHRQEAMLTGDAELRHEAAQQPTRSRDGAPEGPTIPAFVKPNGHIPEVPEQADAAR